LKVIESTSGGRVVVVASERLVEVGNIQEPSKQFHCVRITRRLRFALCGVSHDEEFTVLGLEIFRRSHTLSQLTGNLIINIRFK
jgi:hypothetical protein